MNNRKSMCHRKVLAIIAVVLSLVVLFAPSVTNDDSDGATAIYTYTISPSGAISGSYTPIANNSSSSGKYTSTSTTNVGSWGFDSDGYGPFGSFYAAFDPAQNNKMICHLDPFDLTRSADGTMTGLSVGSYNIMWCLPTVYWKTDTSGNLILTNDENAGGTAYAHTIDGKVYNYIAIGVYEASKMTVDGKTILTSTSGTTPLVSQTRATFRDYANDQSVNTDGSGSNGYAMVWNFYQWELYKYCALAVMGGWDSQSIAGNGSSYGGSPYYDTPGLLNTSGPYAGTKGSVTSSSYNQDPVKVFIENAWGSVYDFVDGVVIMNRSLVVDSKSVPTDATAAGTNVVVYNTILPSSSGYGSSPSTTAGVWGMPTGNSGSQTSGLYDYIYADTGSNYVLYVGGYSAPTSSSAPIYGLSCANAYNALSYGDTILGGRLAFVFDADPAATPTVTLDHSYLTNAGGDATGFETKINIESISTIYPDLNTYTTNPSIKGGWTHIGWEVNGVKYAIGDRVVSTDSHTAKSLWAEPKNILMDHSALSNIGGSITGLPDKLKIESASTVYPDLNTYTSNPSIAAGYVHTGWYIDGNFYPIGTPVLHETTHTALSAWVVPQITLTFVVEGDVYATLTVPKGSCGVVFTPKMVEGVFEGWFYDEAYTDKYDASKILNESDTLYAKGVPPLEFTSVPTASATISQVNAYGLVFFDATDSTGKYQIHWDFGDGNTSDESIAYNTYTQPGKYNVKLTVTNLYGESATQEYTITVGEATGDGDSGFSYTWIVAVLIAGIAIGVVIRRIL